MAWGWRNADERPELERLASEVQAIYLAMPPDHQATVATTIRAMVAAGAGLRVVTDELGGALGRLIMRVFAELHMPLRRKPTAAELAGQIGRGASGLLERLGVTPADLEALVGGR